jgi:rhodanese-related sulfurtransferase
LEIDPMFVTARELRDLLASENPPTLLDVRTEERFDAFHIPNALSLTLLQLGISAPSKMDNTIVVSAGHAADGVAEKVKDLREKGSTLRVLHGGMGAWCRLGGQTTMPCRGADRIGALDLVRVKDEPARLIFVVLSAADTKLPARLQQAEKLLSTARVITFTEPEQAVADMRRALEAEAAGQVVVVDGDGGGYGALRDLVAKELDALVFYLDGGLDAFEAAAEALKGPGDRKTMVSQGVGGTPKPGRPQVIRAPKGCGCL